MDRQRSALLDELGDWEPDLLRAHPLPGKWSILEIVEHLVLAERDVLGGPDRGPYAPSPRTLQHRAAYPFVMLLLRSPIPVPVPGAEMIPTGEPALHELRPMWDANHAWLRAFLEELESGSTKLALLRHPVAGPMTVDQGIRMLDVHQRRHIRQIRRLQQSLRAQGPAD